MTTETRGPDAPTTFDPELRRLAVVVVLGAMMSILDTTIVNVAIDTLGREFHTSLATIQWVLTGYTLVLAMTIPITGWAVRRHGGRTMWITSIVLFVAGSLLCGAAWSVTSLIVFRVVQAVGGGMLMPVGQTMLARAAGPERMGRVMSLVSVPAMLGPVLGPVLGGLIVDDLSWRWMFYVNAPVGAAALVAAVRWLPRDTDRRARPPLDTLGLALLSPGLALLVYGLARAGDGHGVTDPEVYGWAGTGALLIVAFAAHAVRRGDRALVDLRLFRDRAFATSVAAMFCYTSAALGVTFAAPLYFQAVRGDGPLRAGLLLAPMGVGAALAMPVSGRLTDRIGPRVVSLAGLAIVLAGLSGYLRLDADTGRVWLGAAMFVVGAGHGAMMPALMAAMYLRLDRSALPAASATGNIAVRVGGSFGVAALAVVLQVLIRHRIPGADGTIASVARLRSPDVPGRLAHAFAGGFRLTFVIAAAAAVPMLLLPGRRPAARSVVEGDGAAAEAVDDRA